MGTAEVESALVQHPAVAEAAVVGFPHEAKGQGIYAYVTLKQGKEGSEDLKKELVQMVRDEIGAIAKPDFIQWAPGLPKTRSGKIMRRILRKWPPTRSTIWATRLLWLILPWWTIWSRIGRINNCRVGCVPRTAPSCHGASGTPYRL